MVKVIAHRGFSSRYPENTLAAFQGAIDCGADFLELDLQITRDNQLVVFHDDELSRTTNGQGVVEELTLAEIQSYDAGSWFSTEFSSERVPTLDEVLDICDGKIGLNIEIKATQNPHIIPVFEELLARRAPASEIFISSFDIDLLFQLMQLNPNLSCAYAFLDTELLDEITAKDPEVEFGFNAPRLSLFEHMDRAASLGFEHINFRWSTLTPEHVRYAHANGLKVNCWTIDHPNAMSRLVEMGVDGIITNFPDLLLDVLASR